MEFEWGCQTSSSEGRALDSGLANRSGPSSWPQWAKEQVAQNWPMRLNFETLVGTIREVKLSVDRVKVTRSFPGPPGREGLPNNEANPEER